MPDQQFRLRINHYPRKTDIWFRYDPPILIVAATLHNDEESFCRVLYRNLALRYRKTSQSVCALAAFYYHAPDQLPGDAYGG